MNKKHTRELVNLIVASFGGASMGLIMNDLKNDFFNPCAWMFAIIGIVILVGILLLFIKYKK